MTDASHTERSVVMRLGRTLNGSDKPCVRVAFDSSAGEDPARTQGATGKRDEHRGRPGELANELGAFAMDGWERA